MQSKVLVSPPTKDLIQEGSLKMQHHAAPQTVIASMHSTAFTTTHQPPSSCSSWNKKKKHFATLSAGPLWWTGSLFLNAVQAEGWQSQMWHLLSSTPFFGSRKCHFTAELTLSAHRDDHTAALTAMIKEATVCAMVCQENVFALYCLLGQLGMDQPDTDLLVLLDKMRPISRLEDEMCSNEHLAESASGLELWQGAAPDDLNLDGFGTHTSAQATADLVGDTAAALPATEPVPADKHNIAQQLQKKRPQTRNVAASG
jgi:hypothetical protein